MEIDAAAGLHVDHGVMRSGEVFIEEMPDAFFELRRLGLVESRRDHAFGRRKFQDQRRGFHRAEQRLAQRHDALIVPGNRGLDHATVEFDIVRNDEVGALIKVGEKAQCRFR